MARPTFKIDKEEQVNRFSIAGDLSVQYAQELKTFLIQTLEYTEPINVSFDQVISIDAASIQLAYALKKEIERRGRKMIISLPGNESVCDLLIKTGITKIL